MAGDNNNGNDNFMDGAALQYFLEMLGSLDHAPPMQRVYLPNDKFKVFLEAFKALKKYNPDTHQFLGNRNIILRSDKHSFDRDDLKVFETADQVEIEPVLGGGIEVILTFFNVADGETSFID